MEGLDKTHNFLKIELILEVLYVAKDSHETKINAIFTDKYSVSEISDTQSMWLGKNNLDYAEKLCI